MTTAPNHYKLLQIDRHAHVTVARVAYRYLAAIYHPANDDTGDENLFRTITESWKVISDEGKRAAYDMTLEPSEDEGVMSDNLYKRLQVDPEADAQIIHFAYKRLTAMYPLILDTDKQESFNRIKEAWEVLSDDKRRAAYDKQSRRKDA